MRRTIRILSVIILMLPVSIVYMATYTSFIDTNGKWETYVVGKGHHSYYHPIKFVNDLKEIEFYFRTNDSWFYKMPKRPGWNKVRGFSNGFHHKGSSVRLVYKCIDDTLLVVGGYCYVDGVHPNNGVGQQATIDTIQPNKIYHCIIKLEDGMYKIYFEDKYWDCFAGKAYANWGYLLNPFMGGVFTIDHDWRIDIFDVDPEKKLPVIPFVQNTD